MQSVYEEKQIHAVVKLEDQNPFFSTSWEKWNTPRVPISAGKDHISSTGCEILGMQHPGNREEEKRKSRQVQLEAQLLLLWSSAELRVLYKVFQRIVQDHSVDH